MMMTTVDKKTLLEVRRDAIIARGKYVKAPGVLKKITRQIRNLQREK